MEEAVLRMIADWLGRGNLARADGYNDVAGELELDPEEIMLGVEYIGDETRDKIVAARLDPVAQRSLYITADGPSTIDGDLVANQGIRESEDLRVAVRYVTKNADAPEALADSYRAVRAILKSVGRFMHNDNAASRSRTSIHIQEETGSIGGPVRETVGDYGTVTAAVVFSFRVRDTDAA